MRFYIRPEWSQARFYFVPLVTLVFALMAGCRPANKDGRNLTPISDRPLPEEVRPWLEAGRQSIITPAILQEARQITGKSRRERLFSAKAHLLSGFTYDPERNPAAFEISAEDLFSDRILGGCSDYALVEVTLYRAVGIPSRLVLTVNVDWMLQQPADPPALAEGHCFVEVYLENRWHLVDPTFRWLFSEYNPESSYFPHGEYLFKRGKDFWDMGIPDIRRFDQQLKIFCKNFKGDYIPPRYPRTPF